MASIKERALALFEKLHLEIFERLSAADRSASTRMDEWTHEQGGGGKTYILKDGSILEKAGVNFSAVTSRLSETLATRINTQPQNIFATGTSLVIHPFSPMIPTVHMNLRYLELENGDAWFGGGMDMTPWYFFDEDARHFHRVLKSVCDRHEPSFYTRFKKNCDEYFYIKHRNEARGVGGIFFDYLREDKEHSIHFVGDVGHVFLDAYLPIAERRKNEPWGDREKMWQLIRRGRYAEFNLLYDRGTLFGLETRGRTESILMSLPPEVKWEYDHQAEPNSRESALVEVLQKPREWA